MKRRGGQTPDKNGPGGKSRKDTCIFSLQPQRKGKQTMISHNLLHRTTGTRMDAHKMLSRGISRCQISMTPHSKGKGQKDKKINAYEERGGNGPQEREKDKT